MGKLTELQKEEMLKLYHEGKMDTEIAKILNVSDSAIYYWRKKKLNLKSKFNYTKISKINNEKFEELFYKGLSDYKIAKELNMSADGVYSHRVRYGYSRESLLYNKPIKLTNFQKQVLLGTMLGDSSMRVSGKYQNPRISCAHSIKQKEYCEYKTNIFKSLQATCAYHKRNVPDKRNGKLYEDYTMTTPANPELLDWYYLFYKNKKKRIPFELFDYFTEVSLAFMFMDDGCKNGKSYSIATNCFSLEELQDFKKFLYEKFGLEVNIHKNRTLYIRKNSVNLFTKLISPYIYNCMLYKLQSLNFVNLGKS